MPTDEMSASLNIAILIISFLILVIGIISAIVSLVLAIKYIKYNRIKNSARLNGEQIARKILDDNGLQNIKIKVGGSILFGNSYSHYFKKVRLRRRTIKKDSISSLAMGSQKACLAILDKDGDEDMKKRIKFVPMVTFGPYAFIPLLLVGLLLDLFIFNASGISTIVCAALGFVLYLISFLLQVVTLKTEKKAQIKAIEILEKDNIANTDEIAMIKELFKLYNIEYINDMVLAFLEMIKYVLKIIAMFNKNGNNNVSIKK